MPTYPDYLYQTWKEARRKKIQELEATAE